MDILIVDDEPLVCQCLEMFLEIDGHKTDSAFSGDEALAKFDSHRFDLVFTDYFMTGMKGDELARLMKQRAQSLPIIMVSGNPPSPLPDEISKVLLKPYSQPQVRAVVQEVESEMIRSQQEQPLSII